MSNFKTYIEEMDAAILQLLSEQEKGYGARKWYIAKYTGIPEYLLTALLKKLKDEGKIELIMTFDEATSMAAGSGYCLKGKSEF